MEKNMKVNFDFSSVETEMFGSVSVTPPANKKVIGCLFITKSQETDIPFHLAGLLSQKDNSWVLEFPFKGFNDEGNETLNKTGKLTRIKKTKEKKVKYMHLSHHLVFKKYAYLGNYSEELVENGLVILIYQKYLI